MHPHSHVTAPHEPRHPRRAPPFCSRLRGCSAVHVADDESVNDRRRSRSRPRHARTRSERRTRPPAVERAARRAALRFIYGYLRFTYGRATSQPAPHGLAPVRRPTCPPAVRRRHPRIVRSRLEWTSPFDATALATINDGRTLLPRRDPPRAPRRCVPCRRDRSPDGRARRERLGARLGCATEAASRSDRRVRRADRAAPDHRRDRRRRRSHRDPAGGTPASPAATHRHPTRLPRALPTHRRHDGVDWTILAAIGKVECDHGRNTQPGCRPYTANCAGAVGPMQFLPSTWKTGQRIGDDPRHRHASEAGEGYATDGDGDGVADIWDPADAIASPPRACSSQTARRATTAARSSPTTTRRWYVDRVLRPPPATAAPRRQRRRARRQSRAWAES